MDRLARNLEDLRRLMRTLTGKGVRVQFVTENLTFTCEDTAMATLLLSVMGAFAEFERALIRAKATSYSYSYSQGQRLSVIIWMKLSASAAKHPRSA